MSFRGKPSSFISLKMFSQRHPRRNSGKANKYLHGNDFVFSGVKVFTSPWLPRKISYSASKLYLFYFHHFMNKIFSLSEKHSEKI